MTFLSAFRSYVVFKKKSVAFILYLSLSPFFVCVPSAQDMENMSEDDGWEFVNLGDQQSFGIKTAGLEEKATACQMLVRTSKDLCVYLCLTMCQ